VTTEAHWRERAELVFGGDPRILGEDDNGDLFVPSKTRADWWDRPFNPRNPTHWRYWLRSRRTLRIAALEAS
jgi:hypothetical protein